MRVCVLAIVVAAVILGRPVAQSRAMDTSIGVWPWLVGNIDTRATEIVNRARSTGLDTIYLHVWRTTGSQRGELRIADEPGTWSSAFGAKLPMVTASTFIQKAHAAGLQVVGVVHCFRDGVALPADAAHRRFLIERVVRYLVHSFRSNGRRFFGFDGIALDYVRWFGGNHTSTEINGFLDALRAEVGPLQIHAYVPAGAFAVDGATYDNRFRPNGDFYSYVIRNYGQDWAAMARRLDCILPMAYTANGHVYGNNLGLMRGYLEQVARLARSAVSSAGTRCRVVPAIRTWNSTGVTTTQATIEACAEGVMRGGADGYMAFRYFTARPFPSWFQGLSRYAVAGPDRPVLDAQVVVDRIQATVDTSRSSHANVPRAQLTASFDLDGDGVFELGPLGIGRRVLTMRRPAGGRAYVRLRDPRGHSTTTVLRVNGTRILTPAAAVVSIQNGGQVSMQLGPGASQAGRPYIVFAALSTEPGTRLGAVSVPLNVDPVTLAVFQARNSVMFARFAGVIDGGGMASPRFTLPAASIPSFWAGSRLYFAALGLGPGNVAAFASSPVTVTMAR